MARRAQQARRSAAQRERREAERVVSPLPCPICFGRVVGRGRRTCSTDCAHAWNVVRRALDPQQKRQHRVSQALAIMRNPSGYQPSRVRWAERILGDDPPPPNRQYRQRGSRVHRVLEELGR